MPFKIFVKKNSILIFLLSIGFLLRIWNLHLNLHFGYDQGRDALVVESIIKNHKPVLIGPTTGIEGVFLGPFFYYLILPFYFLGQGNPVWPATEMVLLGTLSIYLIYLLGKDLFGKKVGLLAAALLCFSSQGIYFSRMLSNPSPLMFISLLMFWLAYKIKQDNKKYFPLLGLVMGLSLQTQLANAFFLTLAIFLYLLPSWKKIGLINLFLGLGLFLSTFFPQLLFNFRHEHLLSKSLLGNFISDVNKTSLAVVWHSRPGFFNQWFINSLTPSILNKMFFPLVSSALLLGIIFLPVYFFKKVSVKDRKGIILLLLWLLFPIVCYLFYTGNFGFFFDYYIVSQFLPLLLLASYSLVSLTKFIKHGRVLKVAVLSIIIFSNVSQADTFLFPNSLGYSLMQLNKTVNYVLKNYNGQAIWARPPDGRPATYEYLLKREAQKQGIKNLRFTEFTQEYFVIYEPDTWMKNNQAELKPWFLDWYRPLTEGKKLIDKTNFGIIIVEKYQF
ncbi:MAG: glycosyltransferase family 39 protein [Candidatus Beckwithbacteria bacterium]|nr:glycosyltransferase family 39 protein [Candidatus Beckwithbacteria bacterium]